MSRRGAGATGRLPKAAQTSANCFASVHASSSTGNLPLASTWRPSNDGDEQRLEALRAQIPKLQEALDALREVKQKLVAGLQQARRRGTRQDRADVLERRLALLENVKVRDVEWIISDYGQLLECIPRGQCIVSSSFCAAGVAGMQLIFYPNGHKKAREGYHSLHLLVPEGTRLSRSLFINQVTLGPDVQRSGTEGYMDAATITQPSVAIRGTAGDVVRIGARSLWQLDQNADLELQRVLLLGDAPPVEMNFALLRELRGLRAARERDIKEKKAAELRMIEEAVQGKAAVARRRQEVADESERRRIVEAEAEERSCREVLARLPPAASVDDAKTRGAVKAQAEMAAQRARLETPEERADREKREKALAWLREYTAEQERQRIERELAEKEVRQEHEQRKQEEARSRHKLEQHERWQQEANKLATQQRGALGRKSEQEEDGRQATANADNQMEESILAEEVSKRTLEKRKAREQVEKQRREEEMEQLRVEDEIRKEEERQKEKQDELKKQQEERRRQWEEERRKEEEFQKRLQEERDVEEQARRKRREELQRLEQQRRMFEEAEQERRRKKAEDERQKREAEELARKRLKEQEGRERERQRLEAETRAKDERAAAAAAIEAAAVVPPQRRGRQENVNIGAAVSTPRRAGGSGMSATRELRRLRANSGGRGPSPTPSASDSDSYQGRSASPARSSSFVASVIGKPPRAVGRSTIEGGYGGGGLVQAVEQPPAASQRKLARPSIPFDDDDGSDVEIFDAAKFRMSKGMLAPSGGSNLRAWAVASKSVAPAVMINKRKSAAFGAGADSDDEDDDDEMVWIQRQRLQRGGGGVASASSLPRSQGPPTSAISEILPSSKGPSHSTVGVRSGPAPILPSVPAAGREHGEENDSGSDVEPIFIQRR